MSCRQKKDNQKPVLCDTKNKHRTSPPAANTQKSLSPVVLKCSHGWIQIQLPWLGCLDTLTSYACCSITCPSVTQRLLALSCFKAKQQFYLQASQNCRCTSRRMKPQFSHAYKRWVNTVFPFEWFSLFRGRLVFYHPVLIHERTQWCGAFESPCDALT